MAADKIRVGIIGMGMYAYWFHSPQLRATGRAEIVAICRRNQKALAAAQEALGVANIYSDWRDMLEKESLDAVLVSTPHHYHAEPTLGALEHGLPVLVDKPMALTGQEAWSMVEAARHAEKVLMVTYGSRAERKWRSLKRQLAGGIIGQIRQISCSMTTYRRWFWQADSLPAELMAITRNRLNMPDVLLEGWQEWHGDPARMGGGAFPDVGVYWIDTGLWLAGAPAVELAAFTEDAGLPVECFVNVQARLANGVLFSLTFADGAPGPILGGQQQLMIVGEEGTITDDLEGNLWLHQNGNRTKLEIDLPDTTIAEAFVSAILDGADNLSPAYQGANVVDFLESTYRSANEGRMVQIKPGPQS